MATEKFPRIAIATDTDPPDQKPEFKALVSDGIKALPKHLLKQAVGLACMPLGVLAGALYSGTLVGPIIVGAGNHDKQRQDPSLEQTVQRGQMPLVGDLAMGSADMVADGAGLIASVAKEMAAPVTWAVDSYKFGYNLIK